MSNVGLLNEAKSFHAQLQPVVNASDRLQSDNATIADFSVLFHCFIGCLFYPRPYVICFVLQPRYRELRPSSKDGLSLSAVLTCGTVFLRLSAPSTPTRPSAVLSKLICSSLHLTINCFCFLFLFFIFLIYFTICLTM